MNNRKRREINPPTAQPTANVGPAWLIRSKDDEQYVSALLLGVLLTLSAGCIETADVDTGDTCVALTEQERAVVEGWPKLQCVDAMAEFDGCAVCMVAMKVGVTNGVWEIPGACAELGSCP